MSEPAKMTVTRLQRKKRSREKITLLTAYDFPMAKFIQVAGIDVVLVSDAVGTVGLGRAEAVSVSVEEMIYHTQAVVNGAGNAMVVTTLPFGSYETVDQAVTGVRLMKEGHADGIHLEGGRRRAQSKGAGTCRRAGAGSPGITKQKIVSRVRFRPRPDSGECGRGRGRRCSAGERGCLRVDLRVYPRSVGRHYHAESGNPHDRDWGGTGV
ncbi:MAG: 3-methyl-2-oxobutanoate hydroxymethyltransferase [Ahniella sp.]|nr:3-methyl-2-oxobutanoate hydroxymethyltransferase [Ahniella sp.]